MIHVPARVERVFRLRAPLERVWTLLEDVPAWGRLFPRVESVAPLPGEPGAFVWRMEPLGPPGGRVRIVYACRYSASREAHTLDWAPVEGVGNAVFSGGCALAAEGEGTAGTLRLDAVLQIPAPAFLHAVVEASLHAEMGRMTDRFLQRLGHALDV